MTDRNLSGRQWGEIYVRIVDDNVLSLFWTHCSKNHHGMKTSDGLIRGGARREFKKRGRGRKDRVDKSTGIVTLIGESLVKIKPTVPLRFVKCATHKKQNLDVTTFISCNWGNFVGPVSTLCPTKRNNKLRSCTDSTTDCH